MDNSEAPKILRARKPSSKKKAAVAGECVDAPVGDPAPAATNSEEQRLVEDPVPEVAKPEEAVVVEPAAAPPPEPVPPVRMSRGPRGPYKPRVKKEAVVNTPTIAYNPMLPDLKFWAALQHSLRAEQKQAKASRYAAMRIA